MVIQMRSVMVFGGGGGGGKDTNLGPCGFSSEVENVVDGQVAGFVF